MLSTETILTDMSIRVKEFYWDFLSDSDL
jgi:hypothetical protein